MRRLIAALALGLATPAFGAEPPQVLQAELGHLAEPAAGVVGVAAWRLNASGPRILLNADQAFPMASTFKVAVAGKILSDVDGGKLSLGQLVLVPHAMMVESEGLASTFHYDGVSVSVRNLLELMLTVSDNTATDVLTKLAG
jgi:beta-lactamase class A